MFIYETSGSSVFTGDRNGPPIDPLKCNANKAYMTHYQNFLTLDFFAKNGTIPEKAQANKEIEICRRKMKYWERQPHYDASSAIEQKKTLNRAYAR